jgi:hypothetical protein
VKLNQSEFSINQHLQISSKKMGAARGTAPDRLQNTDQSQFSAHEEIICPYLIHVDSALSNLNLSLKKISAGLKVGFVILRTT